MDQLDVLFGIIKRSLPSSRANLLLDGLISIKNHLLECPASSKYHGAYPGGLIDHTIEVVKIAVRLNILCGRCSHERVVFCAVVHDLGKLGDSDQFLYLINPDESKRDTEPYVINKQLVDIPHELRTLYWLSIFGLGLTPVEYQAIFYHAGMYNPGFKSIRRVEPLTHILHQADMIASQIKGI